MDKCSTFDQFEYILKRNKGQKSLRLYLDSKGKLVLSCNPRTSQKTIETFINKNQDWIEKNIEDTKLYSYQTGEQIPFWGQKYTLVLSKGRRLVTRENLNLNVRVTDPDDPSKVRKALFEFYKKNLEGYVPDRLKFWSYILDIGVPEYSINNSKSRWAVCYYSVNMIKISAMTACLPEDLIDMTILHELCHFIVKGHGKPFWDLMKKYLPDFDNREKQLHDIRMQREAQQLF